MELAVPQLSPGTQTNEMLQYIICQHDGATAHGTDWTQFLLQSFHQN